MLQRIQTLWISFAIIAAVLSFEFPFAIGKSMTVPGQEDHIDAASNILLIALTLLSVILSGATLLTYSKLKKQKSLCWIGILFNVVLCMVYLREWKALPDATLTSTSSIAFCIPICLWLGWRGIDRDLKLIYKMGRQRKS